MNTFDTAASSQHRIGLIELPDLAEILTRCGLQVVAGPDFRSAATGIRNEFSSNGAFPIIVGDTPAPGLRAWVDRIQQTSPVTVAVMRNPENPVIVSANVIELNAPVTVNALLAAVGLSALPGPAGEASYPEQAEAAGGGLELPDFDDLVDEDPVQEPVQDQPAPQPAPAAPVQAAATMTRREQRLAEQRAAELRAGQAQATPEPVAEEDPWDSPAETPAQQPQPAPVLDDWDTTPAPQAKVIDFPEPAADFEQLEEEDPFADPAPAPAEEVHDWDTPRYRFQTPHQPAPAAEAPSFEEAEWDTPAPAPSAPAPMVQPVQPAHEPEDVWDSPAPAAAGRQMPEQWQQHQARQAPARQAAPAPAEDYFTPAPQQQFNPPAPAPAATANPFGVQQMSAPVQEDASAVFDDFEASKLHGSGRSAAGLASLVVNYSGKGGVGKSTSSLQMAKVASDAGLRVILIDGNSGQGDLRTYLRLNRTDLPTIYDAAIGKVRDCVLVPDIINQHRPENLGHVNFAFIGAPPDDINDPAVVTDEVYRSVIEFARRNADLVVVDTQIIESADRTGVVSKLILPALVHDAWGMGIADMTNVGVNNLNNRLRKFINEGVPTDRLMVVLNRVLPEQIEMAQKAENYFRGRATFLGAIEMDNEVAQGMNAGRIDIANPHMRSVMSKALLRITGNEAFRSEAEGAKAPPKKAGIIARLLGRAA